MSDHQIFATVLTAADAREHITDLEAERALAHATGIADIAAYMDDLDEEIDVWRHHYTVAALTEIATLRGELFGPDLG